LIRRNFDNFFDKNQRLGRFKNGLGEKLTSTLQDAIELGLVEQLWVLGAHWFLKKN
jgi:hypothetical protein